MSQATLVITGASRGIGHAIATLFKAQQWRVINLSRSACDVADLNITADFSKKNWLETVKHDMPSDLHDGPICLVHNAAFYAGGQAQAMDLAELEQAWQVNVLAPTTLNQWLIPSMQHASSIIYLGSTLSEKAVANAYAYVVCKHAVIGMMRATCQDLAGLPVHTACVCPGFTATEMLLEHIGDQLAEIESRVGAKRLIECEEIADVVYHAAMSPVLNGSIIHANLGQIER